ncbi:MAG: OmpA family protein [Spirochaetaceae bacterium]|nr:OmpA family protein [Spirochaetaceae bacterium]
MGSLGIAIDGGRYVRLDSSIGDFSRSVRLRTLHSGQDSAKLDFCTFRNHGSIVQKSVLIEGLSGTGDTPAELRLDVQRQNYALWTIDALKPDGSREHIRVRTGIGLWPFFILAAVLFALVIWLLVSITWNKTDIKPQKFEAPAEIVESAASVEPVELQEQAVLPDSEAAAVPILPGRTVLYFQPESAVLSPMARDDLNNLIPLIPGDILLEIQGHCANYGTERGRIALSRSRADTVSDYISNKLPESVQIQIQSFGSSMPVNRNPEYQNKNRRVEIIIEGRTE